MMKILLTNDDGIAAPGMARLIALLEPLDVEIAVFAPRNNHSGAGHAITLNREIEILRLPPEGKAAIRWEIAGTPVDAVKFAVDNQTFMPDLVLSGINNGPNMGNNIHYSGTIGAALEAFFHRIPAIALSVDSANNPNWETAVVWGRKILEALFPVLARREKDDLPFLLNVNFPNIPTDEIKGVMITRHGRNGFKEKFFPAPSGKPNHYILAGEMVFPDKEPDIDTVAVSRGLVSVTPLHSFMNCGHFLPQLRDCLQPLLEEC